jgi:hypothetical protein
MGLIVMAKKITNKENVIYVRDLIDRFEELSEIRLITYNKISALHKIGANRDEIKAAMRAHDEWANSAQGDEFFSLQRLLMDCCDRGYYEEWQGHFYPFRLVRAGYADNFADAEIARKAMELYPAIKFDGVIYHCR